MTEYEMVGWHHRLNTREFEPTPRDGEGQGSLVCAAVRGVAKSRTRLSDGTMTRRKLTLFSLDNFSLLFSWLSAANLFCSLKYSQLLSPVGAVKGMHSYVPRVTVSPVSASFFSVHKYRLAVVTSSVQHSNLF